MIVATGVWRMPQRYFAGHGVDAVAELFVRDLTQGIGTSGVEAAIIECATDTEGLTTMLTRASCRLTAHPRAVKRPRSGEVRQHALAEEGDGPQHAVVRHAGPVQAEPHLLDAPGARGAARSARCNTRDRRR